jgi:general secretion pathway protein A
MYNDFFGLRKNPFSMAPDPDCLFLTPQHREAVAGLAYAITSRKGLVVLTGEVGTGKTTVLARVLKFLPANQVRFSVILHPTLSTDEFLEMAMLDFGIGPIPASKAQRLYKLQHCLLDRMREGKTAALIVDEAHKLSREVLEEIRLLGNFDHGDRKLLQIVLVGQSELDDLLRREDLRQLKQRIAVRMSLKALTVDEVRQYIRFRWSQAGAVQEAPFSDAVMGEICRWSMGIPRLINAICDQTLLLAFADQTRAVEIKHVVEAATDLDLAAPARPEAAVAPSVAPKAVPKPVASTARLSEIRVPDFERYAGSKPTRLGRLAAKLGLA